MRDNSFFLEVLSTDFNRVLAPSTNPRRLKPNNYRQSLHTGPVKSILFYLPCELMVAIVTIVYIHFPPPMLTLAQ